MFSSVVSPHPEEPTGIRNSPSAIARSIPSRNPCPPQRMRTSEILGWAIFGPFTALAVSPRTTYLPAATRTSVVGKAADSAAAYMELHCFTLRDNPMPLLQTFLSSIRRHRHADVAGLAD